MESRAASGEPAAALFSSELEHRTPLVDASCRRTGQMLQTEPTELPAPEGSMAPCARDVGTPSKPGSRFPQSPRFRLSEHSPHRGKPLWLLPSAVRHRFTPKSAAPSLRQVQIPPPASRQWNSPLQSRIPRFCGSESLSSGYQTLSKRTRKRYRQAGPASVFRWIPSTVQRPRTSNPENNPSRPANRAEAIAPTKAEQLLRKRNSKPASWRRSPVSSASRTSSEEGVRGGC